MIDPIESFDPKAVLARLYHAADLSFLDDLMTEEERWLVAGEFLLEAIRRTPRAMRRSPEYLADAPVR